MDEQICENCGFERELNRGLCEGCEAERIATAPLLATIANLESRLAEVERERDMARAEAEVLRGVGCEEQKEGEPQSGRCGVCIKCAQAERDEAQRKVTALTEGLRLVSDALDRLDHIYRADAELGDPPVETPMWLREAQHRAAALLAPTPTAREEG